MELLRRVGRSVSDGAVFSLKVIATVFGVAFALHAGLSLPGLVLSLWLGGALGHFVGDAFVTRRRLAIVDTKLQAENDRRALELFGREL